MQHTAILLALLPSALVTGYYIPPPGTAVSGVHCSHHDLGANYTQELPLAVAKLSAAQNHSGTDKQVYTEGRTQVYACASDHMGVIHLNGTDLKELDGMMDHKCGEGKGAYVQIPFWSKVGRDPTTYENGTAIVECPKFTTYHYGNHTLPTN